MLTSIDFFIRYACIGQLFLLAILFLQQSRGQKLAAIERIAPIVLPICFAAFLLLTAPFSPRPEGLTRNILLVLTDATPFFIWWYGLHLFDDNFRNSNWPDWSKFAVGLLALWHCYYFLVLDGFGPYHDLNHLVGLVLMLHLIVSVLRSWNDDLIEQRRHARAWLVSLLALYFVVLALVELSNSGLNRNHVFMLITSILCLVITSATVLMIFNHQTVFTLQPSHSLRAVNPEPQNVNSVESALYMRLQNFIAEQGYLQSDLSITQLAQQLHCPEHHLRKLINQHLGYTNFAAFLHHYRVAEARKRLTESDLPVLSIALDLGYGSIAPFNRAFKDITGETPTAYRSSKQG